jgi:hypothetical protein
MKLFIMTSLCPVDTSSDLGLNVVLSTPIHTQIALQFDEFLRI